MGREAGSIARQVGLTEALYREFPDRQPCDFQVVCLSPTHLRTAEGKLADRHLSDY